LGDSGEAYLHVRHLTETAARLDHHRIRLRVLVSVHMAATQTV
jgi:hypothetical protein